jgi:hypothetical protein
VTGDVFEEHPFRGALGNDAGDVWPEVPGVICTTALTGGAEGLAGISGQDDVECTSEGPCIEAAKIIPYWRRGEIPGALGCDEDSAGPALPFDEGPGVETGFGQHEAQIQASAACAEGQSVKGT